MPPPEALDFRRIGQVFRRNGSIGLRFPLLFPSSETSQAIRKVMSIHVVVQFNSLPGKRAEFENIMRSLANDLPGVPGCQGVQVLQNAEDACCFTLVEKWDSREVHNAHIDGLVADGTWEAIAEHLSEEPNSGYFSSY